MKHIPLFTLLALVTLAACSGNRERTTSSNDRPTSAETPAAYYGTWVRDEPKRTPPDPVPDHYDRTEYEISKKGNETVLTEWSSALDINTKKQWFRNVLRGPITCAYVPGRACLACGDKRQFVKDSLFVTGGQLENRSPVAPTRSAADGGFVRLTRLSK